MAVPPRSDVAKILTKLNDKGFRHIILTNSPPSGWAKSIGARRA